MPNSAAVRRLVFLGALLIVAEGLVAPRSHDAVTGHRDGKRPVREPSDLIPARPPESVPTRQLDGDTFIGANDFARLLDATKFWNSEVRKLVVRARTHRIVFTVDNPFVLVDDRTILLSSSVVSIGGELQIPIGLIDSLPRDSLLMRLRFDPARRVVLQVPPGGIVEAPRVTVEGSETRVTFPVDRPEEAVVASRSRAHFRLRFGGFFVGQLPDSVRVRALVHSVHLIPAAIGTAFELAIAPEASGFQIVREPSGHHLTLVLSSRAKLDLEQFAPEGPPGPRPLRVVVLDPGHGGEDRGVSVKGAVEKDLTLALAKLLKAEIERRMPTHVLLTRDNDRTVPPNERAELANRARADLVLSLHFDGLGSARARGATAFCPPATFGERMPGAVGSSGEIDVLSWRDVATRHAVRSRELADAVLSSLELHGDGPTRLHEMLPFPLLGVNAPGIMLECATLTSDADRGRITGEPGLAGLAATIADGLEAYRNSQ